MSDCDQEAKERVARVFGVGPIVVEQFEPVLGGTSQRKKDVLSGVVRVRRKVDPSLAIVVEGVVEIQPSWRGGDANVGPIRPEEFFDECIYRRLEAGVD